MAALTMDLIKHSALTAVDEMGHQTITDSGNFTQDDKLLAFYSLLLFMQNLGS